MNEIELCGDKNISKNETDEKSFFLKFKLKVIKTNSYKPKCLNRLVYTSWGSN